MLRFTIITLAAFLLNAVFVSITYLSASFIAWNTNPAEWTIGLRFIATAAAFWGGYIIGLAWKDTILEE